ncbi:cyclin-T1 isoform X2 [Cryptotermes secundus]|uniref:cyclin-T1 isoform X2 n=1 Tax=Cryptotermes secundus TaxID=105785 RepID=UPI000CD7AB47|nr:cyclin-T1 isoform X2 [Cryptotermes secundus]
MYESVTCSVGFSCIVSPSLVVQYSIVYMHKFYVLHPFTVFHHGELFLACKVENGPRPMEEVVKAQHRCLKPGQLLLDTESEMYVAQVRNLTLNESILLQTLGFEVSVDHPHTHVVRLFHLVRVRVLWRPRKKRRVIVCAARGTHTERLHRITPIQCGNKN